MPLFSELTRLRPRLAHPERSVIVLIAGIMSTATVTACASGATSTRNPTAASAESSPPGGAAQTSRWPVKSSEHVDLWLHSFAMLSPDSARIPLYRRGYADSLTVVKNRANVLTALDANRTTLQRRLATTGGYLQAQFLPFAFANWDAMRNAAERFLQFEGDPRRAADRELALQMTLFAPVFPAPADREWLRLFLAGVIDERQRFFGGEYSRTLRARAAVVTAVDSTWQRRYRLIFDRFLNNTSQRQGDLLLSLPIGGEGRTAQGREGQTVVAVPFPGRVEDATDVILVFAHEITGTLVGQVVADNTTPAEQRAGAADRYIATGQVQGGLLLLERIAPELRDPYLRFYLAQVGTPVASAASAAALRTTFDRAFPLPAAVLNGLKRQLDIVLGGI